MAKETCVDDVLRLAGSYRRQGCLEGNAERFVCELLNVSEDKLDEILDDFQRRQI